MRKSAWMAVALALVVGCTQSDTNPDWNPEKDLPSWAYDAPFYYRPTEDLPVYETLGAMTAVRDTSQPRQMVGDVCDQLGNEIPVFYSTKEYFFIEHPGGSQVSGVPRIGVWTSSDAGTTWQKKGYFGAEQSHFLFRGPEDARYWVRFVGPAQGVSEVPPGMPHRIYVVDRQPPQIELTLEPGVWKDPEKKIPYVYEVGEVVRLSWRVRDDNLEQNSVRLGTTFADFPMNVVWDRKPGHLPRTGSIEVEIPEYAKADGGMRLRIEAQDKAGNVGVALTPSMMIRNQDGTKIVTTRVGPLDPVQQYQNTPGMRPGWPEPESVLRGGEIRHLEWMPEVAEKVQDIRLEFSVNNGQTWRPVASDLTYGRTVSWVVPEVSSEQCRLRLTGYDTEGTLPVVEVDEEGNRVRVMLAVTRPFKVTKVLPDTRVGPEAAQPEKMYDLDAAGGMGSQ